MLVRIKDVLIDARVAETPEEHVIGLSQTDTLADGEGMLFPYDKEHYHVFHMPDSMKFEIDILFIHDSQVIGRIDTLPVGAKVPGKGKWVLEVPAGFCRRVGIESGDKVSFEEEEIELDAQVSSDILRTLSTASMKRAHMELSEGITDAVEEILTKTDLAIDGETAEKWKNRACAAFYLATHEFDEIVKCSLLARGKHFKDEALEHAAMVQDMGETVKVSQIEIERFEFAAGGKVADFQGPYLRAKSPNMVAQSQSTETAPYSREPSKAPARPTERFKEYDTFDEVIPEGGKRVTEGPIHDEEWNSPTRGS